MFIDVSAKQLNELLKLINPSTNALHVLYQAQSPDLVDELDFTSIHNTILLLVQTYVKGSRENLIPNLLLSHEDG